MAEKLSILSWNLENFKNDNSRANHVVGAVAAKNPDVLGVYEVKGAQDSTAMVNKVPGHTLTITESESIPEFLMSAKSGRTGLSPSGMSLIPRYQHQVSLY